MVGKVADQVPRSPGTVRMIHRSLGDFEASATDYSGVLRYKRGVRRGILRNHHRGRMTWGTHVVHGQNAVQVRDRGHTPGATVRLVGDDLGQIQAEETCHRCGGSNRDGGSSLRLHYLGRGVATLRAVDVVDRASRRTGGS